MKEMKINIEKSNFKKHQKYQDFGANKSGIVVELSTGKQIYEDGQGKIKVNMFQCPVKKYSKIAFIWECHNRLLEKNEYIVTINGSRDKLSNLKLMKKETRVKLPPDEQHERNKQNKAKWGKLPWVCFGCGIHTTNSLRWAHKRRCKYVNDSFTEEQKLKKKQAYDIWRNMLYNCSLCGNTYKNGYRYIHKMICEKHQKME